MLVKTKVGIQRCDFLEADLRNLRDEERDAE